MRSGMGSDFPYPGASRINNQIRMDFLVNIFCTVPYFYPGYVSLPVYDKLFHICKCTEPCPIILGCGSESKRQTYGVKCPIWNCKSYNDLRINVGFHR